MLKILVGIDDTDDIDSKGTGAIADELRSLITEGDFGVCGSITRHQLLIHPDIPYTSHNSSMVFPAEIREERRDELNEALAAHVERERAPSSDPGLCVLSFDRVRSSRMLIAFGALAKNVVLRKSDAYAAAERAGAFLRELGGSGDGVIGALAGTALRYSGNDGELRGGCKEFRAGAYYTVSEVLASPKIDNILDISGGAITSDERVFVPWKVKPVLTLGKFTVFVKRSPLDGSLTVLEKQENRDMEFSRLDLKACPSFKPDSPEEFVSGARDTCLNCVYRRWTERAFSCTIDIK